MKSHKTLSKTIIKHLYLNHTQTYGFVQTHGFKKGYRKTLRAETIQATLYPPTVLNSSTLGAVVAFAAEIQYTLAGKPCPAKSIMKQASLMSTKATALHGSLCVYTVIAAEDTGLMVAPTEHQTVPCSLALPLRLRLPLVSSRLLSPSVSSLHCPPGCINLLCLPSSDSQVPKRFQWLDHILSKLNRYTWTLDWRCL